MKTNIAYGIGALIGVAIIGASNSYAYEVTYNYLPKNQVVGKVVATLAQHGINPDQLYIQANEFGVVNISGEVPSKEAANLAVDVTKHIEGIYALDTTLEYPADNISTLETSSL